MNRTELRVFIPALKKTVAFQDDLVKKLAGVTLIQRAINKSLELGLSKPNIHLLTDSEEIALIAKRNGIGVYWDAALTLNAQLLGSKVYRYILKSIKQSKFTLFLSPYAPLCPVKVLEKAIRTLKESSYDILKPVKLIQQSLIEYSSEQMTLGLFFGITQQEQQIESKAFILLKSRVIPKGRKTSLRLLTLEIEKDFLEINSFQDWWVCEKLLQRKRIIFRVIGNEKVGMGHIYRALSLAHEITDHEILFVSDTENIIAVSKLAGYDYWLEIYKPEEVIQKIIKLQPDLLINDILSTNAEEIHLLQENGIRVVNFEDLGSGAIQADLSFNELYDEAQIEGINICWGHQYFFLRDEFHDAQPQQFKAKINSLLLAFGGTDQHNLSQKIYLAIKELCLQRNIHVHIVTGAGYAFYNQLSAELKENKGVSLTRATGVMSSIMEQSQLAIVSNGRTVYELAHMNIPAIVIPQHKREATHDFSCEKNGFVTVEPYHSRITEQEIHTILTQLLDDDVYREILFERTKTFQFTTNKQRVLKKIMNLLRDSPPLKTY